MVIKHMQIIICYDWIPALPSLLSDARKSDTMRLHSRSAHGFLKANVKIKLKISRFLLTECAWPAAGRQDTLWSGIFPQQPYISTLLHVAIMRDKALSNEQLHVVRTVPITNHCVWRKTFLCTNIPAHSSLALPPHQEGRKMQAVGWTPLLKGQAAVTHIHVWDSGGIQTACLALWLPLID